MLNFIWFHVSDDHVLCVIKSAQGHVRVAAMIKGDLNIPIFERRQDDDDSLATLAEIRNRKVTHGK